MAHELLRFVLDRRAERWLAEQPLCRCAGPGRVRGLTASRVAAPRPRLGVCAPAAGLTHRLLLTLLFLVWRMLEALT